MKCPFCGSEPNNGEVSHSDDCPHSDDNSTTDVFAGP